MCTMQRKTKNCDEQLFVGCFGAPRIKEADWSLASATNIGCFGDTKMLHARLVDVLTVIVELRGLLVCMCIRDEEIDDIYTF